jgi:hypothetical protein
MLRRLSSENAKDRVRFQVLTPANMKMAVFWLLRRVVWKKFTDVSEVLAACIIRTMPPSLP